MNQEKNSLFRLWVKFILLEVLFLIVIGIVLNLLALPYYQQVRVGDGDHLIKIFGGLSIILTIASNFIAFFLVLNKKKISDM